ncbi:MAG: pyridoxamine 5'-phosphate oxidase family protein [Rhodoferax sp.]
MNNDEKSDHTLWDMIKDIKFAMFTTRHGNGHLHSRPMTTQSTVMNDASLWFFVSRKAGPVADLMQEPTVNLTYADPGKDTYVSVSGAAHVVDDLAKTRTLWTSAAQAWFPGGADDPDLALVEVKTSHAHYWDIKENTLKQLPVTSKPSGVGEPARLGESGDMHIRST